MSNFCRRLEDVAAALGLQSPGTIRRWRDVLGCPLVKTKQGYNLDEIRAWARANVRMKLDSPLHDDEPAGDPGTDDGEPDDVVGVPIEELRKRYILAQTRDRERSAELRELKLALQRGELVPLEEIKSRDIARIAAVRSGLLTLPRRLAQELAGLTPAQLEAALTKQFRALLTRFSEM